MFFLLLFFLTSSHLNADYRASQNQKFALATLCKGFSLTTEQIALVEDIDTLIKEGQTQKDKKDLQEKDEEICDPESFAESKFITADQNSLFYKGQKPLTNAGKVIMSCILSQQTTNQKILAKRYAIINYLNQNPLFANQLAELLTLFQKTNFEESSINLRKNITNEEELLATEKLFIASKNTISDFFLNKVPQRYIKKYAQVMSNYPTLFYITNIIRSWLIQSCNIALAKKYSYLDFDKGKDAQISILIPFVQQFQKYCLPTCTLLKLCQTIKGILNAKADLKLKLSVGLFGLLLTATEQLIFSGIGFFYNYKDSINQSLKIQHLNNISKGYHIASRFNILLKQHSTFYDLLSQEVSVTQKRPWEIQALEEKRNFSCSSLTYYLTGYGLPLYYNILSNQAAFTQFAHSILPRIGEIDAYCSLAQSTKDLKDTSFTNDSLHIIFLKNFYHPHITNPVLNDINFTATPDKRFILVSGPNASGKSANTRGMLNALMLALTFNKTSADQSCFSLFDKIFISANLSDQLNHYSKFQHEKQRLKSMYDYCQANPNKKVLLMIDEPLTSVDTDAVGNIMHDLFATFEECKNLVIVCVSNTKSFENIKNVLHLGMKSDVNPDGTYKSTYKWQEGSAYCNDIWIQFANIFGPTFIKHAEKRKKQKVSSEQNKISSAL